MTSLCIMKRGSNEIFSFPLACPIGYSVRGTEAVLHDGSETLAASRSTKKRRFTAHLALNLAFKP